MTAATTQSLIATAEAARREAGQRRRAARQTIDGIIATATAEGRDLLTPAETTAVDQALGMRDTARRQIEGLDGQLAELRTAQADDAAWFLRSQQRYPAGAPMDGPAAAARPYQRGPGVPYDQAARIGYEPTTYRPDTDPNGRGFLLDVARSAIGIDPAATGRLDRHMTEERVNRPGMMTRAAGDATTASFAGLTVPQYLTQYYAPAIAALRPLADSANAHPLPPDGMAIDISRITTASSAALQANELDAVSATSMDDTLLTIPVQTIAGQQKVSRQAIERGTGIEDVTTQDLLARVASALDNTIINQATTGISASAQAITYTSASPTAAEFWPYIFQAHSKLEAALLAMAPVNAVVCHPRRWNWLASQVDSKWPFLGAAASGVDPQQGALQLTSAYGPAVRGVLSNGDKVIVDANVPTNLGVGSNQDEVYVVALGEIHLWEAGQPIMIRAEQVAAPNLGILLVCYEYAAFTCQRYASNPSKIVGSGLVGPTGFL
jgi:HK97 family phage major capsid protein